MTGPISPPQYATKFDPYADRTSKIQATATIVDIYPLVMGEDPAGLAKAANGWTAFATRLILTQGDVLDFNLVRPDWDSTAGTLFSAYVDGTVATFADWYHAATANAAALNTLSGTITQLQQHMVELWGRFEDDVKYVHAIPGRPPVPMVIQTLMRWWPELGDLDPHQFHTVLDPVVEHYTVKVRTEVLEPLNAAYGQAYTSVRTGQKFTGPTNGPSSHQVAVAAAKLAASSIPRPGTPGLGSAGASAPPAPPMPQGPGVPPPAVPRRPASRTVAPPTAPPPPTAAPPPAPPPAPGPMPPDLPYVPISTPDRPYVPISTPDLPYVPRLPTAGPAPDLPIVGEPLGPQPFRTPGPAERLAAPGTIGEPGPPEGGVGARPESPEVPQRLRGRATSSAGPATEPDIPRTPGPQLSGRGTTPRPPGPGQPRGEGPDAPPRRGGPALPGRGGRNRRPERTGPPAGPTDDEPPPNRLGLPRDLLGIRDRRPRLRPGSPAAERPALRTVRLDGRLGTQSEFADEFAHRALRPGRAGRATRTQERRTPDTRTDQPCVDFVGDSELFTPGPVLPAVIERPESTQVGEPRSVLRPAVHKT